MSISETERDNLVKKIDKIVENSSYAELTHYKESLPSSSYDEETLNIIGASFINQFYRKCAALSRVDSEVARNFQKELYFLYLSEKEKDKTFSFEEFVAYSILLDVCFNGLDIDKKIEINENDSSVDYVVKTMDSIINNSNKYRPYAVNFDSEKLNLLHEEIFRLQNEKLSILSKQVFEDANFEKVVCSPYLKFIREANKNKL